MIEFGVRRYRIIEECHKVIRVSGYLRFYQGLDPRWPFLPAVFGIGGVVRQKGFPLLGPSGLLREGGLPFLLSSRWRARGLFFFLLVFTGGMRLSTVG